MFFFKFVFLVKLFFREKFLISILPNAVETSTDTKLFCLDFQYFLDELKQFAFENSVYPVILSLDCKQINSSKHGDLIELIQNNVDTACNCGQSTLKLFFS